MAAEALYALGAGVVVVGYMWWNSKAATRARLVKRLAERKFKSTVIEVFGGRRDALAIDADQGKLAVIQRDISVLDFANVVAVEVCRNGQTITRTNRGSQVAGAVIGAALLGPVGLLVGALTGSKRSSEEIKRLSLKIYTNDIKRPVREVVFYRDTDSKSALARSENQVTQWYGRLRVVVEGVPSVSAPNAAPALSPPATN